MKLVMPYVGKLKYPAMFLILDILHVDILLDKASSFASKLNFQVTQLFFTTLEPTFIINVI